MSHRKAHGMKVTLSNKLLTSLCRNKEIWRNGLASFLLQDQREAGCPSPHLCLINPSIFTVLSEWMRDSPAFLHKHKMNFELLEGTVWSFQIPNCPHDKALPEVDSPQWLLECERMSPGILSDARNACPHPQKAVTALWAVPLYLSNNILPEHERKSWYFSLS